MPKVSVIIPVFNAQEYLAKCLDSIVNQTLKDIEIICINDGSVDSSLKILEGYAQNDSRIVVVSQNNKGQGAARNKGIKIANGEYIAFVDNDDHIDLNFLEAAYKNAKENNADIVFIGNKRHVYENSSRSIMYEATQSFDLLKCKYEMMNEWVAPWCKLYRTDFIRSKNILFSGGKGEDLPFAIYCCLHTDKISLCNDVCYYYSVRANSECRRKPVRKDFVEITQFKKIFKELRLFKLSRKDYTFYKKAIIRRMMTSFDILYSGSSFVNKIFLILLLSTHFPLIFLNYYIFPKIFSIKNSYDKQHKVIYLIGVKINIRKRGDIQKLQK